MVSLFMPLNFVAIDCVRHMAEGMWMTKIRGPKLLIRFYKYDAEVGCA